MNDEKREKNQIIEADARVFAIKWYSGDAVADIAVAADIGKGTVYDCFNSKEELFFAVFEWHVSKTSSALTVNLSALGGLASRRLEALNDAIMNLWNEVKDFFALTIEFWSAASASTMRQQFQDAFKKRYQDFRNIAVSVIEKGQTCCEFNKNMDTEAAAAALVGAWDALFLQAWFDREFEPLTTAQEFIKVVIRGLKI